MDKPIIKKFIKNGRYYFYDTYKNEVLEVNDEQFKEICQLEEIGLSKYYKSSHQNKASKDIELLIEKGYFKACIIDNIEHPQTNYINDILDRGVNNLILQVTRECNFKCRYCLYTRENKINRSHEDVAMTWNIARDSIDYMYEHSADVNNVSISFYGGEPLLNFPLIKRCVEYAKEKFVTKTITFQTTNNGSLIDCEIAHYLIENGIRVMISLDGPKEVQNKHRKFYENGKGTYDVVIRNVERLREMSPEYFDNCVSFNPVLMNDEPYQDVVDFFKANDIDINKVHCSYAYMGGIDYIEGNANRSLVDENHLEFQNIMNREYIDTAKRAITDHSIIPRTWHPNGPCIPGMNRLFVDVFGKLYPCEKILEVSCGCIGDIYNGFDVNTIKRMMNIGKMNQEECKTCWAMRFCDVCVVRCIDIENNDYDKKMKNIACEGCRRSAYDYICNCVL